VAIVEAAGEFEGEAAGEFFGDAGGDAGLVPGMDGKWPQCCGGIERPAEPFPGGGSEAEGATFGVEFNDERNVFGGG
jgi:hypothetical protein